MKDYSLSLMSNVPEIARLRFFSVPRDKALDVVKIARHANTTIYIDRAGRMYSIGVTFSGSYVYGTSRMDDYVRCCAKLGMITRAQMEKHFKHAKEADRQRRLREIRKEFTAQAARLGIVLTKKQEKQLTKE